MSLNGQTQTYMPPTLDGLNIVEADQIYVNGVELDPTNLVTYTGATKALDMNNKAIKTTYTPIVNADVVNLLTLNQATGGTVGYVDEYFVPYNGANSDTNLGNKNLTVTNAGQVSFSNIVKTELNNVLSGYNPASITVGNDFGAITNAAGVYQSTSTAAFASLVLGAPLSGEKYIVSLSLKSVDVSNNTNLYLYGSTTANMSGSTGQIVAFSIPANTTGFTVFTNTITFPVGSTYLLLVYYSQKPSGIDTLYWNAFSLTGMGSVVKNLIAPTTSLDGANKGYVDTQDALRVPYVGASANLQLGSNSLIATTAQFTGVTSATPSLALGVDGSGNLRSFAVPSGSGLLTTNNTWTGTNDFNNNFSAGKNAITATLTPRTWNQPYWTAGTGTATYSYNTGTSQGTAYGNTGVSSFTLNSTGLTIGYGQTYQMTITNMVFSTPASGGVYFTITQSGTPLYDSGYLSTYSSTTRSFNFAAQANGTSISMTVFDFAGASSQPYFFFGTITLTALSTTLSNPYVSGGLQIGSISYPTPTALTTYGNVAITGTTAITGATTITGTASVSGVITATGIATGTPTTTIGLNSSNQLVKYTNPVSSVFTGSVSANSIPYASSTNNFANSSMYQISTGEIGVGEPAPVAQFQVQGTTALCGGTNYANTQGYMASGSLTIGAINRNYGAGSGWNSNTAGILMECQGNTEFAIHDANDTVASFMYYAGNRIYLGRDMGFGGGVCPIQAQGLFSVGGNSTTGSSKFQVSGPVNSLSGGHVCYYTTNDVYPLYQQLNYNHDNIFTGYDCYYDGNFRVSASTGFGFYKTAGAFALKYANGSQGGGVSLPDAMIVNNGGAIRFPVQPWCRLYGSGNAVAVPIGSTWGAQSLYVGQSVGMSNVFGNGWYALQGLFFAPQTGKYQINATFYWNYLVAGNRMILNHYSSSYTLIQSQFCCIEGAGISGDTVRQYSTMLSMNQGEYFFFSMASGSNGSTSYFAGYEHSQMSIYMVH